MTFLHPNYLWALLVIIVPILVHLFDFRRPKKVYFSSVTFLKSVEQKSSKGLTIKKLLLLFTRIFAIISIVLLFAQPLLPTHKSSSSSNRQIGFFLDNSMSMQTGTGRSLLDEAIEWLTLANSFISNNTSILYTDNDFQGKDQIVSSPEKLKDRLTEINYSYSTRNPSEILKRQLNLLQSHSGIQTELWWFSDFQKSTWNELKNLQVPKNVKVKIVPLGLDKQANINVDSIWLDTPFLSLNDKNTLHFKMSNSGTETRKDLVVKFLMDDVLVSSVSVSINEGSFSLGQMDFHISKSETKRCKLVFDDFPVVFDNEYYFVLNPSEEINVMTISNDARQYVQKVVSGETFFKSFNYTFSTIDYGSFAKSDVIIVEGISKCNSVIWEYLEKSIASGKTVLLIPTLEDAAMQEITKFKTISISSFPTHLSELMGKPSMDLPFMKGVFDNLTENITMPNVDVLLDLKKGEELFKTQSGKSLLRKYSLDKGTLFVLASPISGEKITLSKHAVFVPFIYKIATSLSNYRNELAYSFGSSSIVVKITNNQEDGFLFKGKSGEFYPSQSFANGILTMELPRVGFGPGFYDLYSKSVKLKTIAINTDPKESDLRTMDLKELQSILPTGVELKSGFEKGKISNSFKNDLDSTPLWKYFLFLALLFLLIEILIIRFWVHP